MHSRSTCEIECLSLARVLEFVTYRWPTTGLSTALWPVDPGAVRRDGASRMTLLHFAPGRVLVPDPSTETLALLEAASASAGTTIDATGKWQQFRISGPGATRLLASAIEPDAVLEQRECAAVTLFDCPAVMARTHDGFELWVQASYAADFTAAIGRFRAALEPLA